jgi:hypothetical protein
MQTVCLAKRIFSKAVTVEIEVNIRLNWSPEQSQERVWNLYLYLYAISRHVWAARLRTYKSNTSIQFTLIKKDSKLMRKLLLKPLSSRYKPYQH